MNLTELADKAALTYIDICPDMSIDLDEGGEFIISLKVGKKLGMKHLGTGACRMVLIDPLYPEVVYKFAHTKYTNGMLSNQREETLYRHIHPEHRHRFAEVFTHSSNYEVIVQRAVSGITLSQALQSDRLSLKDYRNKLAEAINLGRLYHVDDINSHNVMVTDDGEWVIVDYAGFHSKPPQQSNYKYGHTFLPF